MLRRHLLTGLAGAIALPALAIAHEYTQGAIFIGHPWSRAAIAGGTGGAFLSLTNKGTTPDRLIAIRAAIATKAELHMSLSENGVMKMREVEGGLALPPGETVKLEPGGYHIMLMGLKAPLVADTRVPMTLVFEKAGEITVDLAVGKAGAQPMHHHG